MNSSRNYTNSEIDAALRAERHSRSISFRYDLLNRIDTKIGELDGISGKISHGTFKAIKRSATFTLNEYLQREIDYLTEQIQPWFILNMPDGGTVEWSLGIFQLLSPGRKINGNFSTRDIGAYDKTIIIDRDRFTERWFIPKGTNYIGAINKILIDTSITKINIEPSDLVLSSDREFAIGTKKKEAVDNLLNAINYNSINVDELGYMRSEPYIEPVLRSIDHKYIANRHSIITPEMTETLDYANIANVFTRVATNTDSNTELLSTFRNDNPQSSISTIRIGYDIVNFETISDISSQAALDSLVRRIAINSTSAYSHLTFSTALMPTHGRADTIYIDVSLAENDPMYNKLFPIPMIYSETAWDMSLTFDGMMTHECRKVIKL